MRHYVRSLALCPVVFFATHLPGQETPYSVEDRDGVVSLSAHDDAGIPLQDFIKIAQRITGKLFMFSAQEVEGVSVAVVGTVRLEADRFFEFFQTMAYIQGFACILRGEGDEELVEVVRMQGSAHRADGPTYVSPADLAKYAGRADVSIITSISLQHLEVLQATETLHPFSGGGRRGLTFGSVGKSNSLLLQGSGPRVYLVSRVIELIDVPIQEPEIRIIRLEHTAAEKIGGLLRGLFASRRPEIRIVSHGEDTLLVSVDDQETIAAVLDVIALLDR